MTRTSTSRESLIVSHCEFHNTNTHTHTHTHTLYVFPPFFFTHTHSTPPFSSICLISQHECVPCFACSSAASLPSCTHRHCAPHTTLCRGLTTGTVPVSVEFAALYSCLLLRTCLPLHPLPASHLHLLVAAVALTFTHMRVSLCVAVSLSINLSFACHHPVILYPHPPLCVLVLCLSCTVCVCLRLRLCLCLGERESPRCPCAACMFLLMYKCAIVASSAAGQLNLPEHPTRHRSCVCWILVKQ